jgi:hypothetical protein
VSHEEESVRFPLSRCSLARLRARASLSLLSLVPFSDSLVPSRSLPLALTLALSLSRFLALSPSSHTDTNTHTLAAWVRIHGSGSMGQDPNTPYHLNMTCMYPPPQDPNTPYHLMNSETLIKHHQKWGYSSNG